MNQVFTRFSLCVALTSVSVVAPLLLAVTAVPIFAADPAEDAKREITAYYNNDHILSGNGEKGVIRTPEQYRQSLRYYAKDFVCIYPSGAKRTLPQIIDETLLLFRNGAQSLRGSVQVSSFELKGETAVVTANGTVTIEMRRKDGTTFEIPITAEERDFWIKKSGKWFLKRSRVLSAKNVDGTDALVL